MSEWESVSLKDVAANKKFAIVDGPFGTQLHASEYQETGVPVVRVVNLTYAGKFVDNKLVYISNKKANSIIRSEVVPGDILIAKTGATIGKSGMFPKTYSRGIIASSCLKFSINPNVADNQFFLQLISSNEGQKRILDGAGGSTRTTINIKPFEKIKFKIPPLLNQRKIGLILKSIDSTIEKTEALIEKYQNIKAGLMRDLFTRGITADGKLRPPSEEAPELYQETAIGWMVRPETSRHFSGS